MVIWCGMGVRRVVMLGVSVRELKVLTVMVTVTVIGKVDRL
jgi:hypothetical protein